MHYFATDKNNLSTHPINFITIATHGNIFPESTDLPGLKPMKNAMKEVLINKHYEYTVTPIIYHFKKIKKISDKPFLNTDGSSLAYPRYKGILKYKNNDFSLTGFEKTNIPIKFAWIIKEIK